MSSKITLESIESLITEEHYHVFAGTSVTVCCLVTKDRAYVTGESMCFNDAEFNGELGRKYSRAMAIDKLFEREAYHRKSEKRD